MLGAEGFSLCEIAPRAELRSVKSQTSFILQLGYFKAKNLFFTFDLHETEEDILYILEQYFPNANMDNLGAVDKRTRGKQRRLAEGVALY